MKLESLEAILEAKSSALLEAQRAVREISQELSDAETNPMTLPGATFAEALSRLKRDLERASAEALYAGAQEKRAREVLEAARIQDAEASEPQASAEVAEALRAFVGAAQEASETLARRLAICEKAIASREVLRATLREAGRPPERDGRTSMAASWSSLQGPSVLQTAANVVLWASPSETFRREAEDQETQRRRSLEIGRQEAESARRGDKGVEEQERALSELKDSLRRFHFPGNGAMTRGARGTSAQGEIEIMRKRAGLVD